MHHHLLKSPSKLSYTWRQQSPIFDELIVSFNAQRPLQGTILVSVRVLTDEWSSWMPYALWSRSFQKSFSFEEPQRGVFLFQDTLEIKNHSPATAFEIKLRAEEGADLSSMHSLHACTTLSKDLKSAPVQPNQSIKLSCKGFSQMCLPHPKKDALCSPTSTTALLSFLQPGQVIDPLRFAEESYDFGWNIFGNWILNLAAASTYLPPGYSCWAERLENFQAILTSLQQQIPVVISVRGPLIHSAKPYASGHLLLVHGYDATSQEVLCMDPAFPTDEQTLVRYPLQELVQAWERRGKIAYIFCKNPL